MHTLRAYQNGPTHSRNTSVLSFSNFAL